MWKGQGLSFQVEKTLFQDRSEFQVHTVIDLSIYTSVCSIVQNRTTSCFSRRMYVCSKLRRSAKSWFWTVSLALIAAQLKADKSGDMLFASSRCHPVHRKG